MSVKRFDGSDIEEHVLQFETLHYISGWLSLRCAFDMADWNNKIESDLATMSRKRDTESCVETVYSLCITIGNWERGRRSTVSVFMILFWLHIFCDMGPKPVDKRRWRGHWAGVCEEISSVGAEGLIRPRALKPVRDAMNCGYPPIL